MGWPIGHKTSTWLDPLGSGKPMGLNNNRLAAH